MAPQPFANYGAIRALAHLQAQLRSVPVLGRWWCGVYPSLTFRKAYARLQQRWPGTKGDAAYLRILHLAASTLESEVQAALDLLLEEGAVPTVEGVREWVGPFPLETPALPVPDVDLGSYDQLLEKAAR